MARLSPQMSPEVARIVTEAQLKATDPGRQFLGALGSGVGNLIPNSLGGLLSYYALGGQQTTEANAARMRDEGAYKRMLGEAALGGVAQQREAAGLSYAEKNRELDLRGAEMKIKRAIQEGNLGLARAIFEFYKGKTKTPFSMESGPTGGIKVQGEREGPRSVSSSVVNPKTSGNMDLLTVQYREVAASRVALANQRAQIEAAIKTNSVDARAAQQQIAEMDQQDQALAVRQAQIEGAIGNASGFSPGTFASAPTARRIPTVQPDRGSGMSRIDTALAKVGVDPGKFKTAETKLAALAAQVKKNQTTAVRKMQFQNAYKLLQAQYMASGVIPPNVLVNLAEQFPDLFPGLDGQ